MKDDRFDKLLAFLNRLDHAKISYILTNYREDAISVELRVPGEHWEVDFLVDGDIEVERYRSNGHIHDQSILEELFAVHAADAEAAPEGIVNQHDAVARK